MLKEKADQIRQEVISVAVKNGAGHIAPSLSCVDILTALYYGVMNIKKDDPFWEDRDRLIFSKAHGCYAVYAILADKGIMPKAEWELFYTNKSTLAGCMERRAEYAIEAGCGSLGHGLPVAVGLAFGAKLQRRKYNTFCVAGDGELQEGTTWEAIQFATKHELSNLVIIIDRNRLQAMDHIENVLDRTSGDLARRLEGFGLKIETCPGHDPEKLVETIKKCKKLSSDPPKVIIAETVKGYGLKCMENVPKFHFRIPTDEELAMEK